MTRLDEEYDPAEHHDLVSVDGIYAGPPAGERRWMWTCACGESAPSPTKTRLGSIRSHRWHQEAAADHRLPTRWLR